MSVVKDASADVAGMSRFDLKLDYDFKGAVKDIVEDMAEDDYDFKRTVKKTVEGCSTSGFVFEGGGPVVLRIIC